MTESSALATKKEPGRRTTGADTFFDLCQEAPTAAEPNSSPAQNKFRGYPLLVCSNLGKNSSAKRSLVASLLVAAHLKASLLVQNVLIMASFLVQNVI